MHNFLQTAQKINYIKKIAVIFVEILMAAISFNVVQYPPERKASRFYTSKPTVPNLVKLKNWGLETFYLLSL